VRWLRDRACIAAIGGWCAVSPHLLGAPRLEGLHVARVVSGPLRGGLLAMPTLQRPSFALGTFESHVVAAMRAHVRPGGVAYDVGANIGYHTLVLGKLVGSRGTVFAFEPAPRELGVLRHNLRINRQQQVRVIPSALADEPGSLQFATFDYSGIGHLAGETEPADATILTVPVSTLDDFIYGDGNPPPDFIKIDVEGAEARVLLGATRLLSSVRPAIVCEVRWGATYEPIAALMLGKDYQSRVLWRDGAIGGVPFTAADRPA